MYEYIINLNLYIYIICWKCKGYIYIYIHIYIHTECIKSSGTAKCLESILGKSVSDITVVRFSKIYLLVPLV